MRRQVAALAAAGAVAVLAHPHPDVPVVPAPVTAEPTPQPVFTAAALDDRTVVMRLRAIDARYISRLHEKYLATGGGRGSPAGHGHPRAQASQSSGPGRHLTFAQWLARPETRKIKGCESGGNYRLVDYNKIPGRGWVAFYGAWQMDEDFVSTYAGVNARDYLHGGKFTLSASAQDRAAYAGWVDRGDEPWSCR